MARGGTEAAPEIKAVICDADVHVQDTLRRLLPPKGITIVGVVSSFDEAKRLVDKRACDVLLLHGGAPGAMDGIDQMRARGISTPVVIISGNEDLRDTALAHGAAGFYYKGRGVVDELLQCIRTAVTRRGDGERET
jgi:DNA-binding NarL/FixJ family response regulator